MSKLTCVLLPRDRNLGPVLRVFRARPKEGMEDILASEFAETSAPLVRAQPALLSYIAARPVAGLSGEFLFVTLWSDIDGLAAFAGERWREAVLPPGYADLLEWWAVEHYLVLDRGS